MKEYTFWVISSLTVDEIKRQIVVDGNCALRFAYSEEDAQAKLSQMACFCRAYKVVIYEPE